MKTISATIENGVIVPCEPLKWPHGADVVVTVREPHEEGVAGEEDDPLGDDPACIERWIDHMENTPFVAFTDDEWEAMKKERQEEKVLFARLHDERIEKLAAIWK